MFALLADVRQECLLCEPELRRVRRSLLQGLGFGVWSAGCRVQGSGFRVQGSGFRVQGSS